MCVLVQRRWHASDSRWMDCVMNVHRWTSASASCSTFCSVHDSRRRTGLDVLPRWLPTTTTMTRMFCEDTEWTTVLSVITACTVFHSLMFSVLYCISLRHYTNVACSPEIYRALSWVAWRGGIVVRASILLPRGRRFESRPLRFTYNDTTLGKLFTHVCLCLPSSINWYRGKLGAKQALHATH